MPLKGFSLQIVNASAEPHASLPELIPLGDEWLQIVSAYRRDWCAAQTVLLRV